MDYTGVRGRAFVQRNFTTLVIVLVVLALAGGWMTYAAYAAADQMSTPASGDDATWASTSEFNHSATVTEANSAHSPGTTLDDRDVYPLEVAPQFHGTYTYSYQASNGGSLDGNITLLLVIQSVDDQGEEQTAIWKNTEPIAETAVSSLEPGETVTVPFEVNMSDIANRTAQINEEFGNPSGTDEVKVVATIDTEGTVNNEQVDISEKQDLFMSIESALYRVTTPTEQTTQYGEQTNSVTTASSTPASYRIGGPLALLIAVGGLGGLGFLQSTGRLSLSESELMWLAFHEDREDFDDWITTIKLPDEAFDRPRAEADSLASLVDLAIDTDNSVIEDPDEDGYYVLHDEYLYTYVPPAADSDPHDSEASSETDAAASFTGSDDE